MTNLTGTNTNTKLILLMNNYVQKNAQLDSMEIYCSLKGYFQLRVLVFLINSI